MFVPRRASMPVEWPAVTYARRMTSDWHRFRKTARPCGGCSINADASARAGFRPLCYAIVTALASITSPLAPAVAAGSSGLWYCRERRRRRVPVTCRPRSRCACCRTSRLTGTGPARWTPSNWPATASRCPPAAESAPPCNPSFPMPYPRRGCGSPTLPCSPSPY